MALVQRCGKYSRYGYIVQWGEICRCVIWGDLFKKGKDLVKVS
jgi:hypothetical protein